MISLIVPYIQKFMALNVGSMAKHKGGLHITRAYEYPVEIVVVVTFVLCPHQPAPFANDPVRGPPLSASREDVKALINDPIDIID
jgi:hypothetical protein